MALKPMFRSSKRTLSTELQDLFVISLYSADNFSERISRRPPSCFGREVFDLADRGDRRSDHRTDTAYTARRTTS